MDGDHETVRHVKQSGYPWLSGGYHMVDMFPVLVKPENRLLCRIWPWRSRSIVLQNNGDLKLGICTSGPNLVILAWTGDELWCGQALNGVNFDGQVKFDLEDQGRLPPKNNRDLNQCILHFWSKFGDHCLNGSPVIARTSKWLMHTHARARADTQTDAGNDNTRRPKLASGKKSLVMYPTTRWDKRLAPQPAWTINSPWLVNREVVIPSCQNIAVWLKSSTTHSWRRLTTENFKYFHYQFSLLLLLSLKYEVSKQYSAHPLQRIMQNDSTLKIISSMEYASMSRNFSNIVNTWRF